MRAVHCGCVVNSIRRGGKTENKKIIYSFVKCVQKQHISILHSRMIHRAFHSHMHGSVTSRASALLCVSSWISWLLISWNVQRLCWLLLQMRIYFFIFFQFSFCDEPSLLMFFFVVCYFIHFVLFVGSNISSFVTDHFIFSLCLLSAHTQNIILKIQSILNEFLSIPLRLSQLCVYQ